MTVDLHGNLNSLIGDTESKRCIECDDMRNKIMILRGTTS